MLVFFGLAEGRPPKAPNNNNMILSKAAPCFGVFWFGRGPPLKAPKKISVIPSKEARCFGVFWFGRRPPLESMTTVAQSVTDNLKQFLRR